MFMTRSKYCCGTTHSSGAIKSAVETIVPTGSFRVDRRRLFLENGTLNGGQQ